MKHIVFQGAILAITVILPLVSFGLDNTDEAAQDISFMGAYEPGGIS